jgi:hypothetical protein
MSNIGSRSNLRPHLSIIHLGVILSEMRTTRERAITFTSKTQESYSWVPLLWTCRHLGGQPIETNMEGARGTTSNLDDILITLRRFERGSKRLRGTRQGSKSLGHLYRWLIYLGQNTGFIEQGSEVQILSLLPKILNRKVMLPHGLSSWTMPSAHNFSRGLCRSASDKYLCVSVVKCHPFYGIQKLLTAKAA